MRPTFAVALAYLLVSRLLELFVSERHERRLLARGGRRIADDGLGPLVAAHVAWIAGLCVEEWVGGPPALAPGLRLSAGLAFAFAELARFACVRSLGERWTVRVVVVDGEAPVTRGLYRWLRHPNYVAVVVSMVALPLALGRPWTAAISLPLQIVALARRVAVENAALHGPR